MAEGTQRRYEAPCPGCGAPVAFQSAQSTHAVCAYCHSSVVRTADALARLGRIADEFTDYSPLKIGATGQWKGQAFTLVGRLQLGNAQARWTDWQAVFDDQSLGSLSEDNGSFVFSTPVPKAVSIPAFKDWRLGLRRPLGGKTFAVSAITEVSVLAAQGELGHLPAAGQPFGVVELRSDSGEVCSIDYASVPPAVWLGSEVRLDDLKLTGLAGDAVRKDQGRHFNCPNCAARLEVKLETTKSMSCPSCNALIDLSAGIGGELKHAIQDEPVRPLIPLGTTGQLRGIDWQVVGYQHRSGTEPGEDEVFGWQEYLLYNRKAGFQFLVDAEDGWSLVKPATGAPQVMAGGKAATYLGTRYALQYSYRAETQYVAGEFYWKVERGQVTENSDYGAGRHLLSLEKSKDEWTWSVGERLESAAVAKAFKLDQKTELFKRTDAAPLSDSSREVIKVIAIVVLFFIVAMLMRACDDCDPQVENCSSTSGRWGGGSFGGSSSGGWHK
ncbi:DUF4178 domain-containing protein [Hydrogenophaga sp.]|uniref:DUF4178 domain-containing protein n=1 Tax=Hydrogenophaga sp. TaxID=1904254 RepID=UPI0035B4E8A0